LRCVEREGQCADAEGFAKGVPNAIAVFGLNPSPNPAPFSPETFSLQAALYSLSTTRKGIRKHKPVLTPMPDYKSTALAVKSVAEEARRICAGAPEGRLRRCLDEVSRRLTDIQLDFLQQCLVEEADVAAAFGALAAGLGDVAATLRRFRDSPGDSHARENVAPLLQQLADIQIGLLREPSADSAKNETPPAAASPSAAGFDAKKFEPLQLPSGVTVYSQRLSDGSMSEYYYCPNCFQKGRASALEFKFGGAKKYLCLRCASVFYVDTPPPEIALAPPPEVFSPPPPEPEPEVPPPPPEESFSAPRIKIARGAAAETHAEAPAPPKARALANKVKPRAWSLWREGGKSPPESDVEADASPRKLRWARWKKNFGGDGFLVSAGVHALLFVALLWIVLPSPPPPPPEDFVFSTGSGGGKDGKEVTFRENRIQYRQAKEFARARDKLTVKSPASKVNISEATTPEMNALMPNSLKSMLSKGAGGGLGGGSGGNIGLGTGGRNFASKMVMGVRINAKNIAVYLDNSGSMVPYLESVKAEIYKQFPDADIYEYDGIRIRVVDGVVENGRPPSNSIFSAAGGRSSRKEIIERYGGSFSSSSVGAWVDIMLYEGYDTLIIFSDFQDGIEQLSAGTRIFVENPHENYDRRAPADKKWEKQWLSRFSDPGNGMRLYLFSIEVPPQTIWQQCVKASRGAIRMRPDLHYQTR
jgi:hypothetical protein